MRWLQLTAMNINAKKMLYLFSLFLFIYLLSVAFFIAFFMLYLKGMYWVPQRLPHIYTVITSICIGKVAWLTVYICANIWNAQYDQIWTNVFLLNWPIFYSKLLYTMGQDFLDIQYAYRSQWMKYEASLYNWTLLVNLFFYPIFCS